MNSKLTLQIGIGAAIITVAALSVLLFHTSAPSDLVPTAPISQSQPSGGQQADSSSLADTPKVTDTSQPQQPDSTARHISSADSKPRIARSAPRAPKQQQVSDSIDTPEFLYRALQAPNDPYATNPTYAWQHTKTNSIGAWTTGNSSPAVIAVIDTGFALQHEDLATQWHTNPQETGQTGSGDRCWTGTPQDKTSNGCDDDDNGYTDDWRGWNFHGSYEPTSTPCATNGLGSYVSNNNPQAGNSGDDIMYGEYLACEGIDIGDPFESIAHGTSVAGLAGAASGNGVGVATTNWQAKIMPLQVLGDDGIGWTSDIVAAIQYAVDNGADVISISLGGDNPDPAMEAAVRYAYERDVPIVAASGNCGSGKEYGCDPARPGYISYPARYPSVIAVGSSTSSDTRADYSSYGFDLDVVAPSSGAIVSPTIFRPVDTETSRQSTDPSELNYTNRYATPLYGTSFAAPIVANITSLVKSYHSEASVDDVTAVVNASARKVPAMGNRPFTNELGHGVIDAGTLSVVGSRLYTTSTTPVLAQTGNSKSEHSINIHETMSSGCTASANSYCTVRLKHLETGTLRFLPYQPTEAAGKTGWHWPGSITTSGVWDVRAQSSTLSANAYVLIHK